MSPSSTNPYAPRVGCPLCTIVAVSRQSSQPSNAHHPPPSHSAPVFPPISPVSPAFPPPSPSQPLTASLGPSTSTPARPLWTTPTGGEVIYRDDDVTVYIEKKDPVSSRGHMVVVFNAHIPSLYSLTPASIPILQRLLHLLPDLLAKHFPSPSPPSPTTSSARPASSPSTIEAPPPPSQPSQPPLNIGFITPPFRDPKLPITSHLHLHAYLGSADLLPWLGLRALAYSSLGWYALEDLIAEIRESTSNNRVKTGYEGRGRRPIDRVPEAGARVGGANGRELVEGEQGRGQAVGDRPD